MNTQKGFAPILIILIAVVVIGGGGVYFYTQDNLKENTKEKAVENNSLPTDTEKKVVDETPQLNQKQTNTQTPPVVEKTSNLSLYANTKYGFELSVPKEWKVVFSEGRGCCGRTSIARFFIGVNPFLDGMDRGLSVYVYDRKDDKQYEEMKQGNNLALATIHSSDEINKIAENGEKCLSEHIKDIKVGESNLSAIEIYDATDDCFSNIYQFVVKGNTYDYIITPWPTKGTGYVGYDGKLEVSKTLPEFNQILSSFNTTAISTKNATN